ncbi:MAG: histidine kinase dimerization/phosphoacceptor domain-containing protein, partial [Nocardioidaceae bacterium]|nr:histidine kinase dimerization/phosphoacceptor domain-containing protein [Nocardioidaceae bacterium]
MRSWSELGQVERVDVYTRVSLYFMLWGFVGMLVLAATPRLSADEDPSSGAIAAWVAGIVVVLVAATVALREVMDLHPDPAPIPWRWIALLAGLGGVSWVVALALSGVWAFAITMPVMTAMAWALGGLTHPRSAPLLLAGCLAVVGSATREVETTITALTVAAFVIFTVRVSLWVVGVVREIDDARTAQAALAVAEERLRFSRDIHDVMGRRLSAIALQSELAATLADRGARSAQE